ncbi:MAG: hypothetical protein R3C68_04975 [Myxococcota bacterium]
MLNKALAAERQQRYNSAAEMAKALESLLIQDRSIYDAAEASTFMRRLFDEATGQRDLNAYANINEDVLEDLAASDATMSASAAGKAQWDTLTPARGLATSAWQTSTREFKRDQIPLEDVKNDGDSLWNRARRPSR